MGEGCHLPYESAGLDTGCTWAVLLPQGCPLLWGLHLGGIFLHTEVCSAILHARVGAAQHMCPDCNNPQLIYFDKKLPDLSLFTSAICLNGLINKAESCIVDVAFF